MKEILTIQDGLSLSAYLDDQLAPHEKQALESRLQKDPALRAELESLRRTRALLRAVPQRKAPRSFALSPEQARQAARRKSFWFPALSFSSAISALLLILTLLTRFSPAANLRMLTAAEAPQAEMLAAEPAAEMAEAPAAPDAQPTGTPVIIIWGDSNLIPGQVIANGRGGGSDTPYGGGGAPFTGGGAPDTMMAPEAPAAEVPAFKGGEEESSLMPTPTSAPMLEAPAPAESLPQAESAAGETQPLNPILGIAPSDKQGEIASETAADASAESADTLAKESHTPSVLALPIVLARLAAGSALAAFTWRRKGIS